MAHITNPRFCAGYSYSWHFQIKVSDIKAMVSMGVMFTPALFVNGKKRSEDKVPNNDEIKKYLREA